VLKKVKRSKEKAELKVHTVPMPMKTTLQYGFSPAKQLNDHNFKKAKI
jgi:hypothetical protein